MNFVLRRYTNTITVGSDQHGVTPAYAITLIRGDVEILRRNRSAKDYSVEETTEAFAIAEEQAALYAITLRLKG